MGRIHTHGIVFPINPVSTACMASVRFPLCVIAPKRPSLLSHLYCCSPLKIHGHEQKRRTSHRRIFWYGFGECFAISANVSPFQRMFAGTRGLRRTFGRTVMAIRIRIVPSFSHTHRSVLGSPSLSRACPSGPRFSRIDTVHNDTGVAADTVRIV